MRENSLWKHKIQSINLNRKRYNLTTNQRKTKTDKTIIKKSSMFRKPIMEDVIWQRDRIQQDSFGEFYMDNALANPNSIDFIDSQTLEQTNPNRTSHHSQPSSSSSLSSCFHVFGSCMGVFKYTIENETLTRQARNVEKQSNRKNDSSKQFSKIKIYYLKNMKLVV